MAKDSPETTISQAKAEGERVAVTWGDGHRSLLHAAWLRHAIDTTRPDQMNGVSSWHQTMTGHPGFASTISATVSDQDSRSRCNWDRSASRSSSGIRAIKSGMNVAGFRVAIANSMLCSGKHFLSQADFPTFG